MRTVDQAIHVGARRNEPWVLPRGVVSDKRPNAQLGHGIGHVIEQQLAERRKKVICTGLQVPRCVKSRIVPEKILGDNEGSCGSRITGHQEEGVVEELVWEARGDGSRGGRLPARYEEPEVYRGHKARGVASRTGFSDDAFDEGLSSCCGSMGEKKQQGRGSPNRDRLSGHLGWPFPEVPCVRGYSW